MIVWKATMSRQASRKCECEGEWIGEWRNGETQKYANAQSCLFILSTDVHLFCPFSFSFLFQQIAQLAFRFVLRIFCVFLCASQLLFFFFFFAFVPCDVPFSFYYIQMKSRSTSYKSNFLLASLSNVDPLYAYWILLMLFTYRFSWYWPFLGSQTWKFSTITSL